MYLRCSQWCVCIQGYHALWPSNVRILLVSGMSFQWERNARCTQNIGIQDMQGLCHSKRGTPSDSRTLHLLSFK